MKNKTLATTLSACLSLVSAMAQNATDTPTCNTPRDCELMWSDALDAIAIVSNMRIRLETDTRIETFAPTRPGTTGAVVKKRPIGDNGYEVKIEIECYKNIPCDGLQASGSRLFNTLLNSRKKSTN